MEEKQTTLIDSQAKDAYEDELLKSLSQRPQADGGLWPALGRHHG